MSPKAGVQAASLVLRAISNKMRRLLAALPGDWPGESAILSAPCCSKRQRLMTMIMKEVLPPQSTDIPTIRAGSRHAWRLISARDLDMQLYCHFTIHKVSEELFISIADKDKGRVILHSCCKALSWGWECGRGGGGWSFSLVKPLSSLGYNSAQGSPALNSIPHHREKWHIEM